MEYTDKTNEELIELLEDKQETINQLEGELEEAKEDAAESFSEMEEVVESSFDIQQQEELAEKSFYAGRESDLSLTPLRAFLIFKLEARL